MLVAKYEPGKKGNQTHIVPATAVKLKNAYGSRAEREVVTSSGIGPDSDTPLCTLFLTFSDAENKELTTAHVFTNTKPRLYPQTRKTTYKTQRVTGGNNSQMSLTSPSLYTDDDSYDRQRLESLANTKSSSTRSTPSRLYENQLVQEVSLTYSAPYTAVAKPSEPLALQIGSSGANSIDEYSRVYEENGNLHSYVSDYDSRFSKYPVSVKRLESVERVLTSGKIETEFPVKQYASKNEVIPYFSAQSAIQSAKTTPNQTPRATPVVDSRASTVRLPSSLSQNTVISESTTIEELTTITTTNSRTSRNQQLASEMPTVNALTEQFEATARREKKEALKSRSSPNQFVTNGNGNGNGPQKSNSRVVVINRSNQNSNGNKDRGFQSERSAYSPAGVVTTTIVDIEPPGYGRRARIEEYRVEEEWRSTKTYPTPQQQNQNYQHQSRTPSRNDQTSREEAVEIFVRSQSRGHVAPASTQDHVISTEETISQTSPTVRNVIERFETRIEEKVRPSVEIEKENVPRSVSRVEMNKTSEDMRREEEIIIARRELEQNLGTDGRFTWTPKLRPVEAPPAVPTERVQPDFIRTYEEERTTSIRMDGSSHGSELRTVVSDPPPQTFYVPKRATAPPPPTPASPAKQNEQTSYTEEFMTITTKREEVEELAETTEIQEFAESEEYIIPSTTPEPTREYQHIRENDFKPAHEVEIVIKPEEPAPQKEYEPEEKEEANRKKEEERKKIAIEVKEKEYETKQTEEAETYEKYQKIFDRDIRVNTYEEYLTTRRREKSLPPPTVRRNVAESTNNTFIPASSYLTSSFDVSRSRSTDREVRSRLFSNGRYRATSEGRGFNGGAFASGMSSAGTICTTQLRDAREREKREIGLLNDRLADYIEKVRFLEAQNRILNHDIDILRNGFAGGGQVSRLYESEITKVKHAIDQTNSGHGLFDRDVDVLTAQIDDIRQKWLDALAAVRNHRTDQTVDLDKLAKIEAEISLFKRKITIVEEDVIRVKRENDGIHQQISALRSKIHHEASLKNEFTLHIQDLLHRVRQLEDDNTVRIEQELVYIRRDTTPENRDFFRQELQAAIRDIRADYDTLSQRNREEIEEWYRKKTHEIKLGQGAQPVYDYKAEITTIRSSLTSLKTRVSELESKKYLLEKMIEDLTNQLNEEAQFYEISLSEKEAAISRLRDQCTELTIQMEKLCDVETSLRIEIEKYRSLLNGANVTTYSSSAATPHYGATRVTEISTTSHTSQNTGYSNIHHSSRSSGLNVGGNIGGISVGGNIGGVSVGGSIAGGHGSPVVGRSAAGSVASTTTVSTTKPDRIHDDEGEDDNGRQFRSWYKGTIRVKQVQQDYIELENICIIRRVDVTGFRIEHRSNGRLLGSVEINRPIILDPKQTLKLYSSLHAELAGELIFNFETFDVSTNAKTSIFNATEPHEERGWFAYLS